MAPEGYTDMESGVKHLAWAASLVACVYLASTNGWPPITIQVVASGSNQPQGTAGPVAATAPSGVVAPAATVPAPAASPTVQSPQPAAVPAVAYATIEDAKVARRVTETLGKLEAVADIPAGTPEGQVATIFFDPRCPYCHAAFTAMHGRIAARWVPVVVLGEPEAGTRMAAAILAAPDRVAALKKTFEQQAAQAGDALPEMAAKIAENREALASIFAAAPQLRPGVPTMFAPRPDGRLAIMVGYEAGDEAKLRSVLTGS